MKHRRRLSAALTSGFLVVCALPAQVDPPPPDAPPAATSPGLTLEECVHRALAQSFDIEISRYNPQISKEGIDIARDPYQPVVSVTASRSHSRDDGTSSIPLSITDSSQASVGVTQQLYSGTTLTLSSQLDRSRIDPALTALNPAYNADLTIGVRQQLLKGFGFAANRAVVHAAEASYDAAQLSYKADVLTVVQNTEKAYYNLVFAGGQLEVHRASRNLAQVLYNEAVDRKNTGVATELDVFTADVAVQSARRQVLLDEQTLGNSRDQLRALIGRFELDAPLTPGPLPEAENALPVYASVYQMAIRSQPDYLAAAAAVEEAKFNVVIARNGARPSLSVGGAVGLNSSRSSASSAVNDALANQGNSWQVDLSLTYPWGQLGDKARYRQSLAGLSQSEARLRQLDQNIQVQVRSAVRAVETNHESVIISTNATALAVKQYDLQKAKFDAGLATSRDVLQSQTDLETARLNELQARVSLRDSYSDLHRLEGSALQRYGVALP